MSDWESQPTRSIPLERGDILVFLTDGVLDSMGATVAPSKSRTCWRSSRNIATNRLSRSWNTS